MFLEAVPGRGVSKGAVAESVGTGYIYGTVRTGGLGGKALEVRMKSFQLWKSNLRI